MFLIVIGLYISAYCHRNMILSLKMLKIRVFNLSFIWVTARLVIKRHFFKCVICTDSVDDSKPVSLFAILKVDHTLLPSE